MSPPLSHPFRPPPSSGTVQASYEAPRAASSEAAPAANTVDNGGQSDSYYSPEEVEARARRKLKFIGGGVAVVLLYSILSTAFGDLSALFGAEKDARHRKAMAVAGGEDDEAPAPDREIKTIREKRAHAANKAGFFDTFFCSGRRHSTFCD